ncbi:MAG: methyltransferase domain-containing protein [Micromonosporaceae bacterium]
MWDPAQYQRHSDARSRAFFELTARIAATSPRYVVDFGCGPGNLTAALAERWPDADVLGVDSSAEMLEAAQAALADHKRRANGSGGSLSFRLADLRDFELPREPDVIVSNAVLHWIPDHHDLLRRWVSALAAGGWLAFQIPANFDQPINEITRDLARSPRWRDALADIPVPRLARSAADYLDPLAGAGCEVDAWETTYQHIMQGEDPVLDWYKGTALRPAIAALPAEDAAEYLEECAIRLREKYPARSYGTVLPFRRVFVVARKRERSR